MALINCPRCNKKVSDKASICPNCKYPISSLTESEKHQNQNSRDYVDFSWLKKYEAKKYKTRNIMIVISIFLLAITITSGILMGIYKANGAAILFVILILSTLTVTIFVVGFIYPKQCQMLTRVYENHLILLFLGFKKYLVVDDQVIDTCVFNRNLKGLTKDKLLIKGRLHTLSGAIDIEVNRLP